MPVGKSWLVLKRVEVVFDIALLLYLVESYYRGNRSTTVHKLAVPFVLALSI